MFGFARVLIVLFSILVLGLAAVLALPRAQPQIASMPAGNWTWSPFATAGGRYELPPEFEVIDAFSSSTPYLGHVLCEPTCPLEARVAYVRKTGSELEAFLMHGKPDQLSVILGNAGFGLDTYMKVGQIPDGEVELKSGQSAKYQVRRVEAGTNPADDIVFFFATYDDGRSAFVMNGGARAADFILDDFLNVARGVTLPKATNG